MTFISYRISCSCRPSVLFDEESVDAGHCCPDGKQLFAKDIWFIYIFHLLYLDYYCDDKWEHYQLAGARLLSFPN